MILRPSYLEKISKFIGVRVVKILAGIRRCGKSTIFEMLKEELRTRGVDQNHIISRQYSNQEFGGGFNASEMYEDLKSCVIDDQKYYILLDEVQEIDGWERVVNTLFEKFDADIYVTGSNSKLMSSEISTYLSGRYVTIPVYPLSLAEYFAFQKTPPKSTKELLLDYVKKGGFPLIASENFDEKTAYSIVADIYNSIVVNDITRKHAIKDIDLFSRVVGFVVENVGKTFSANSIVNFLKNEKRTLSVEAIYNYIKWLGEAFIIYPCQRYDLQGKSVLKTQEKYYLSDPSIKYCKMGFNAKMIASMLENIVFLEMKRRGYDVYIGKNSTKEIDFVGIRRDERIYVQVCRELPEESERETENLKEIKDHYHKYVVSMDEFAVGNDNGVEIVHVADFLLREVW